jgi:serine/threonine protein kinase
MGGCSAVVDGLGGIRRLARSDLASVVRICNVAILRGESTQGPEPVTEARMLEQLFEVGELGQRVAIKFLRSDISKRPNVAARFLDEGRAAASLHSEHVVRVMDVGQLDSGLPYLVMEHLEGTDLEALAEMEGAFDVDSALDYVVQVCSALSEAHASQLVHRDIKPENLFLVESAGRTLVKVLDFGQRGASWAGGHHRGTTSFA